MPSLGFNVFKQEVKNGHKRQTIRKHRKRPIKVGNLLYLYWHLRRVDCELLRKDVCTETFTKPWKDLKDDENVARRDGFKSTAEMQAWFNREGALDPEHLLDVIRW
jgi:hypothetical protein